MGWTLKKWFLVVLEDDKGAFPRYEAVPVVNDTVNEECPEVKGLMEKLSKYLNEDVMIDLNYQVDVEGKKAKDVAHEFLLSKGLIK